MERERESEREKERASERESERAREREPRQIEGEKERERESVRARERERTFIHIYTKTGSVLITGVGAKGFSAPVSKLRDGAQSCQGSS